MSLIDLAKVFLEKYGNHSLNDFGAETYRGSLTSIMFDYWRSFLAVKGLVEERSNNDIMLIFREYHKWDQSGRTIPLTEYFGIDVIKSVGNSFLNIPT